MNTEKQLIITKIARLYTLVDRGRQGDEKALEILKNKYGIKKPELLTGVILGLKLAAQVVRRN
jgi:hypothetical protein